jgi:phosphatidylserine decarboxylase
MTIRSAIVKIVHQDGLNFVLTNRMPRRTVSRLMGWFSRIEQPLVRDLSIGTWRFFSGLDLSEARETRFASMHACFTRHLKDGARPIDPDPAVLVSPCDGIVGACGRVEGDEVLQVKGFPYAVADLLTDEALARSYRGGCYVTLRLTSSMYHRFHAPYDLRVSQVDHVPGDAWNVNPVALRRVPRLFCRNERAVIRTVLSTGAVVTLVPVAAILVAGIRLRFLTFARGRRSYPCDASLRRGEEMGWFEHGSTIIVFAPAGFEVCVGEGETIRMGERLLRAPSTVHNAFFDRGFREDPA